jgi:hypothetical protein
MNKFSSEIPLAFLRFRISRWLNRFLGQKHFCNRADGPQIEPSFPDSINQIKLMKSGIKTSDREKTQIKLRKKEKCIRSFYVNTIKEAFSLCELEKNNTN